MLNKNEEFKIKAKAVHGDRYVYSVSEYTNTRTKLKILCPIHGIFTQLPSNHILLKQGCRKCGYVSVTNRLKNNTEVVKKELDKVKPNHITPYYDTYIKSNSKMKFNCSKHGDFEQYYQTFREGHFCPTCGNLQRTETMTFTQKIFLKRSKDTHGDKYDYSESVFVNTDTNVIVICKKHGRFETNPRRHWNGANCTKCNDEINAVKRSKGLTQFIKDGNIRHNNFYDYSGITNYVNNKTPVPVVCPLHGEFPVRPDNHTKVNGTGCPICKQSKGEKKIYDLLVRLGIRFMQEYRLPNSNFRYDFYLPDYDILIEYDGALHFKAVEHFGGEQHLKLTKYRDLMKNRLAKKYNKTLIRINYRMFNSLENNLLDKISKHYRFFYKNKFLKKASELSFHLEEDGIKNVFFTNYLTKNILSKTY